MESVSKSEWFALESPLGEPEVKWNSKDKYYIERIVNADNEIIWFGQAINWKKELNKNWTVLSTNLESKPLTKYLPEIVYGDDRTYWKECDEPLYETLYNNLKNL